MLSFGVTGAHLLPFKFWRLRIITCIRLVALFFVLPSHNFACIKASSFQTFFSKFGKMKFGEYPEGYNRNIHGPYDPARYYGKPDTPFFEVRLLDLPSWLSRRSWNPVAWGSAIGRSYWRWQHKWIHPKRAGMAGIHQFCFLTCTLFYFMNYQKHRDEMNYKYH